MSPLIVLLSAWNISHVRNAHPAFKVVISWYVYGCTGGHLADSVLQTTVDYRSSNSESAGSSLVCLLSPMRGQNWSGYVLAIHPRGRGRGRFRVGESWLGDLRNKARESSATSKTSIDFGNRMCIFYIWRFNIKDPITLLTVPSLCRQTKIGNYWSPQGGTCRWSGKLTSPMATG